MLTITDLHNEQELSSFEMGKVAGGDDYNKLADGISSAASTAGNFFSVCGFQGAAETMWNLADHTGNKNAGV
jgi:hypothetical protein